jgi:DNA primase
VSTPITWDEVQEAVDAGDPQRLVFEMNLVIERVVELGDLFEPVLSDRQQLGAQLRGSSPVAAKRA